MSGGKLLLGAEVYDVEIAGAIRVLEAQLKTGDSTGLKLLLDNQKEAKVWWGG